MTRKTTSLFAFYDGSAHFVMVRKGYEVRGRIFRSIWNNSFTHNFLDICKDHEQKEIQHWLSFLRTCSSSLLFSLTIFFFYFLSLYFSILLSIVSHHLGTFPLIVFEWLFIGVCEFVSLYRIHLKNWYCERRVLFNP